MTKIVGNLMLAASAAIHVTASRAMTNVAYLAVLTLFSSFLQADVGTFVQVTNFGGVGCLDTHSGIPASCASGGILTNGFDAGSGTASGDYLQYHLAATATAGGTGELVYSAFGSPIGVASAVSEVIAYDVITVSNGPDQGFLHLVFNLGGTQTEDLNLLSGNVDTFINVHNFENNAGPNGSQFRVDGSVGGLDRTATLDVPFAGGIVGLNLVVGVEAECFTALVDTGVPVGCNSSVDLTNTVNITGVGVEDINGIFVPGATLNAASGTIYPSLPSTAVPEPASVLLLLTALAGLPLFRLLPKRPAAASQQRGPGCLN